jgi:hypothetical protein
VIGRIFDLNIFEVQKPNHCVPVQQWLRFQQNAPACPTFKGGNLRATDTQHDSSSCLDRVVGVLRGKWTLFLSDRLMSELRPVKASSHGTQFIQSLDLFLQYTLTAVSSDVQSPQCLVCCCCTVQAQSKPKKVLPIGTCLDHNADLLKCT